MFSDLNNSVRLSWQSNKTQMQQSSSIYLLILLWSIGEEDAFLHVAVQNLLYGWHVTFYDILHLSGNLGRQGGRKRVNPRLWIMFHYKRHVGNGKKILLYSNNHIKDMILKDYSKPDFHYKCFKCLCDPEQLYSGCYSDHLCLYSEGGSKSITEAFLKSQVSWNWRDTH